MLLLPQRYKFSSKSQPSIGELKMLSGCCCYRKGTNFQANHNEFVCCKVELGVVVATAKVQIFKQITTREPRRSYFYGCCCYRKGTNFQANHNSTGWNCKEVLLLLLPQRYKFSSKSQRCWDSSKVDMVVVATAKVQIFKQITTDAQHVRRVHKLLLLPQRYKFSSKSQPDLMSCLSQTSCCCYRKGTNFQANHN